MSCTARRRHASTGSKAQYYYHRIYDSSHQQSLECRESRTSSCRMQAVDDPAPVRSSTVPDLSDDSFTTVVTDATHVSFNISSPARRLPDLSTHRTHSRATPHCPLINRVTVRRAAARPLFRPRGCPCLARSSVVTMSCTCILAKPAGIIGLSTFHGALCMQHSGTARFCPPVGSSSNRVENGSTPAAQRQEGATAWVMSASSQMLATAKGMVPQRAAAF